MSFLDELSSVAKTSKEIENLNRQKEEELQNKKILKAEKEITEHVAAIKNELKLEVEKNAFDNSIGNRKVQIKHNIISYTPSPYYDVVSKHNTNWVDKCKLQLNDFGKSYILKIIDCLSKENINSRLYISIQPRIQQKYIGSEHYGKGIDKEFALDEIFKFKSRNECQQYGESPDSTARIIIYLLCEVIF